MDGGLFPCNTLQHSARMARMQPLRRRKGAEQWPERLPAEVVKAEEEAGAKGEEGWGLASPEEKVEVKTESVNHPHPTDKCSLRMNSSGRTLWPVLTTSARRKPTPRLPRLNCSETKPPCESTPLFAALLRPLPHAEFRPLLCCCCCCCFRPKDAPAEDCPTGRRRHDL